MDFHNGEKSAVNQAAADTVLREALARFFAESVPAAPFDPYNDDLQLVPGILDSLAMVNLTMFLADELNFELSDDDFTAENFATLGNLVRLVSTKTAQLP